MKVELSNSDHYFHMLNPGDTFVTPECNKLMMKMHTRQVQPLGFEDSNAVLLSSGRVRTFDDNKPVIPVKAKVVLDHAKD